MLKGDAELPPSGNDRRIWLGKLKPPFLSREHNEWVGNGTGFLEGSLRRLHSAGSHPGLSDQEDSTFRLQLVFLVGRLLLRRLSDRLAL
jgi:hypothetical protein